MASLTFVHCDLCFIFFEGDFTLAVLSDSESRLYFKFDNANALSNLAEDQETEPDFT